MLTRREDQGQMEVLLVAVKKEMVDDYIIVLSEAGLNPLVMDVDSFAIENMFQINYPDEQEGVVALINIGATETNIVLNMFARFVFPRYGFRYGVNH